MQWPIRFAQTSPTVATKADDGDDTPFLKRQCFVIMPFGEKFDQQELVTLALSGFKADAAIKSIDFNRIYDKIIKPAVEAAGITECVRADKISQSGFIQREMLEHVVSADVAIVDITTQNANVFYELGVRHAFRRSTTVVIRRSGTSVPFNIAGLRVFDYSDDETPGADGSSLLEQSKKNLTEIIEKSFARRENDSLVHNLLSNVNVQRYSMPLFEQRWTERKLIDFKTKKPIDDRKVGFVTGDVMHVKVIDAWINPENTQMEMARPHDSSVSSLIRYFGAKRRRGGGVTRDTVRDQLRKQVGNASVEPGTVVVTTAGALRSSNNVKAIFHVAGMQGEPGCGYQPVRDYPGCVRRALGEAERLNQAQWPWSYPLGPKLFGCSPGKIESVLLPLFGSRSGVQSAQSVATNLFKAAACFLEQHPHSVLKEIYFLAWTDQDRQVCETALGELAAEKIIESRRAAGPNAAAAPLSATQPAS